MKCLLGSLLFFFIINSSSCQDDGNTYQFYEFKSSDNSEKIYIKSMNWGMTGDSQLSSISTNEDRRSIAQDSTKEYIFKGLEPFLFRFNLDTLYVYTRHPVKSPTEIQLSKIKVVQIAISNSEFIEILHKSIDKTDGFHHL